MLTTDQIISGLPDVTASPTDGGRLEFIAVRPTEGGRESRERVYLSPESGVEGDRWQESSWLTLPDGSSDPRVQVSLMNVRLLRLISGDTAQMALAGDNLILDLDLSEENIMPGQKLAVGDAVVEITDVPHDGCGTFMSTYGRDVVAFVNSAEGKRLHLRGRYARVIQAGMLCVGDRVHKV